MKYNPISENLEVIVTMEPGEWVGLGYGDSMGSRFSPVEMVIFQLYDSIDDKDFEYTVGTYKGTGNHAPSLQPLNDYTCNYANATIVGKFTITCTRPLTGSNSGAEPVPLDEGLSMVWASSRKVRGAELQYHAKSFGSFNMVLTSSGYTNYYDSSSTNVGWTYFMLHGFFMMMSWTVGGLMIIVSQRYLKHLYVGKQVIHSIVAFIMFGLTLGFAGKAIQVNMGV